MTSDQRAHEKAVAAFLKENAGAVDSLRAESPFTIRDPERKWNDEKPTHWSDDEPTATTDPDDIDSRLGWKEPEQQAKEDATHRSASERYLAAILAMAMAGRTPADWAALRVVLETDQRPLAEIARSEKISRQLLNHSLKKLRRISSAATS